MVNESCAAPSTQELFSSYDVETDDIFLTVHRSTKAICLIYNTKAKNNFIAEYLGLAVCPKYVTFVTHGVFAGQREVK